MNSGSKPKRREVLLAGLGLVLAGCASTGGRLSSRPGPAWPDMRRPIPSKGRRYPTGQDGRRVEEPIPDPVALGPIRAIPRSRWARGAHLPDRLNTMGHVSSITVHHEGWTPVWFDDTGSTAARLDLIRKSHLERMRAGDIGYHFVIDRAGRLWEGRSLSYQGAHVKNHNPHNVGVMCLGNFDLQRPSETQQRTLQQTLIRLASFYRVRMDHIYTHQELNPTDCPGRNLQQRMVSLRQNSLVA